MGTLPSSNTKKHWFVLKNLNIIQAIQTSVKLFYYS